MKIVLWSSEVSFQGTGAICQVNMLLFLRLAFYTLYCRLTPEPASLVAG